MLTRCPQCETLYPLSTAQLRTAEGRVRCSRCQSVFYGLEHLYRDDSEMPSDAGPPELNDKLKLGPEPFPLQELTEQQSPDQAFDEEPPALLKPDEPLEGKSAWGWWVLILLLTIGIAGQLAWLERRELFANPQTAGVLEAVCERYGCRLPQRRAVEKIQVLQRELVSLEGVDDGLKFSLVLMNQAAFAQPFPFLQLELFDKSQQTVGKRIFTPGEYLSPQPRENLLAPGQNLPVQLELLDPGSDITGFEINLL